MVLSPSHRTTLHPFNGLFSRTTWISRHQRSKPFWILLEQKMMGWQWHQLDHMQIICTSLQTDNHASTSPLITKNYWNSRRRGHTVSSLWGVARRRFCLGIWLS